MTLSRRWIPAVLALSPAALTAQTSDRARTTEPLSTARFAELQHQLTPNADAPWRSIPWRVDLLAAQREAAEANRPLFIWAMDGHPLGCT